MTIFFISLIVSGLNLINSIISIAINYFSLSVNEKYLTMLHQFAIIFKLLELDKIFVHEKSKKQVEVFVKVKILKK